MRLKGKVCVVTGASQGVGRGIAIALGAEGATVVLSARNEQLLKQTAEVIEQRGGEAIVFPCDFSIDEQVSSWAARIERSMSAVDCLVNCASFIPDELIVPGPFWDKPVHLANQLTVGVRSSYVATHALAPLMIRQLDGLVVNISSPGSRAYMHGPAYGACKAGIDKLGHDMAHDFKPYGVTVVTLWPGVVATEKTQAAAQAEPDKYGHLLEMAESVEFNGRVIGALLCDSTRNQKSGQVYFTAELAQQYGVTDVCGKSPASHRDWFGETTQFSAAVVQ